MDRTSREEPGIEIFHSKITTAFRRLLDWHCDLEGQRRPRRPNLGEFVEQRLKPLLEKEGKPPSDYEGHKKRAKATSRKRPGRARRPQAVNISAA